MPDRRFAIDCALAYEVAQTSDFVFLVHAMDGLGQRLVRESLHVTPALERRVVADPIAGHRFMRLQAPAGRLRLRYRAEVEVTRPARAPGGRRGGELPIAGLPDEVLKNLMPTRYCESDLLGPAARKLFGHLKTGRSRVLAICEWIRANVEYRVGSSDTTTTARDTFVRRAGVCRDFAHLAVTFCRALNIPARLAAGYAVFEEPPPDFHAVLDVYLEGGWQMFDPTQLSPPQDLVRIAVGRDAKDVAFATIFGTARGTLVRPSIRRLS